MKKKIIFLLCILLSGQWIVHAQLPGSLKWKAGWGCDGCPAIGTNGTIYVGGDQYFYALNTDGTEKWKYDIGYSEYAYSSPAIDHDTTIYFGYGNSLFALTENGSLKWTFTTGDDVYSAPAIGTDGTIYFGSRDKKVYALNPDGSEKWSYPTGDEVTADPSIGADGTIYIGSDDSKLYAFNPDGTVKWKFSTRYQIEGSVAIDIDGTIYVCCHWGLHALNPYGLKKWEYRLPNSVFGSPVIGLDRTIYIGTDRYSISRSDAKIHAISPDGTLKWTYNAGYNIRSTPAIDTNGNIYFTTSASYYGKKTFCLTPDGDLKWSSNEVDGLLRSPAIGPDGTLYIAYGSVYAFVTGSDGLADSPWPKFHQNYQNTGSLKTVYLEDFITFDFFTPGTKILKNFKIFNPYDQDITINDCNFDNSFYSSRSSLPINIQANSGLDLTAEISPDSTKLYQSLCQISYDIDGENKTCLGQLSAGLFLDDDSELAQTMHSVVDAYNACYTDDPNSAHTENNLGLIYRFLGASSIAEQKLLSALSTGMNNDFSYTGIKMNVGVVKSFQGLSTEANDYYSAAWRDINANIDQSAIAPQIYYNMAREHYKLDNLDDALTLINTTINHSIVNDLLKAKAYVLRGAILFRQGDLNAAEFDFRQAISLDPDGPIGFIAQENLQAIIDVADTDNGKNLPKIFVLMPNYPNPFNPETIISFGLPVACKVELVIYNVLGQKIYDLFEGNLKAGWHNVNWNGTNDNGKQVGSGVYLLKMKTDAFESAYKMTLLR